MQHQRVRRKRDLRVHDLEEKLAFLFREDFEFWLSCNLREHALTLTNDGDACDRRELIFANILVERLNIERNLSMFPRRRKFRERKLTFQNMEADLVNIE